jgi:hypothetical protein
MKEETLEDAAENHHNTFTKDLSYAETRRESFIEGAKWQQERMYSEEDMINFAHFYFKEEFNLAMMEINKTTKELLSEWFERNKKKFG